MNGYKNYKFQKKYLGGFGEFSTFSFLKEKKYSELNLSPEAIQRLVFILLK